MAPGHSRGHCLPGSGHRAPGRGVDSELGSVPLARAGVAAPGRGLQISPVGRRGVLRGHKGAQEPALLVAPAVSPRGCCIVSSPQNHINPTYPTDHINKVWQERCNLRVGLQVLEGNLKRKGPHCTVHQPQVSTDFFFKEQFSTYVVKF